MFMNKRLALYFALVAVLVVGLSAPSAAQIRRGRRGGAVVVVGGPYYFADPFWYGYPWYPFYQYPIGPYPPYRGYYRIDSTSSVRLEVTPKEAEVYVDGYYAGLVDDYDGVFQRLHLEPGDHDITLYREGYRAVHQAVYLTPRATFKIRYAMQRLAPGDVAEPRPTPPNPPPAAQPGPPQPGPPPPAGPPPPRRGPFGRQPALPPDQRGGPETSSYGTLSIRVQPAGATILIDGERWAEPQGPERLVVEVAEGTHRVQVQREGFEPFSADVMVRRGETTPFNVSLRTR